MDLRIAVNDYAGQFSKVKNLVNFKNLVGFGFGILGKLYAQAVASGMFILFAVTAIAGKVIYRIRSFIGKTKIKLRLKSEEIFMLSAVLIFLGALLIASLYKATTISNQKYYEIVMTRYIDYAAGPIILCGFYIVYHLKDYVKYIILSYGEMVILILATYIEVKKSYHPLSNIVNTASVYPFIGDIKNNEAIIIAGIISILFSVVILSVVYMGNRHIKKEYYISIVAVIMICIVVYNGISEERTFVEYKQEEVVEYVFPIIEYIEETTWNGTIYYIMSDSNDSLNFLKILQFMLPDQEIKLVTNNEIDLCNWKKNDLLMWESGCEPQVGGGTFIVDTGRICVSKCD